ncbi:MAG: HAD family phosphatase [Firmicutes bacterium]|nr:HAD family phosphatase [Bacillota bacterium]
MRGFIFDVDGVLLDALKVWDDLGIRYLKTKGVEAEKNLSEILYPMSLEQSSHYMKETYHLPDPEEEIISGFLSLVEQFYEKEVELKPDVKEYLESIQEYPMVICTTNDRKLIEAGLKRNGIEKYFSKIFTCSEEKVDKNTPEIYKRALAYLNLPAKDVVYFEDSLRPLLAAKSIGLYTIGVEDAYNQKDLEKIQEASHRYIRSFKELL